MLPYPPDRLPDVLLEVFTLLADQISVAPRIEGRVQPDFGPGSQERVDQSDALTSVEIVAGVQ